MPDVVRFGDIDATQLIDLLSRYRLEICLAPADAPIPGSFWGEDEAGLIGNRLYLREDTPVHSILHEACHYVCMDSDRRARLHTDAGGSSLEESAVCYLQVLLAAQLHCMAGQRIFDDMDRWGYSFRLGSSRDWFDRDAEDARDWLAARGLIDSNRQPRYQLR